MLIIIEASALDRRDVLFLVGGILWVGPVIGLTIAVMRALNRYLKHYLARRHLGPRLSAETRWQAQMELLRIFGKESPQKRPTHYQPKLAAEMNHERYMARRLALFTVIWIFVGWALLYGLVALGSS